jgi:hypothetical protein
MIEKPIYTIRNNIENTFYCVNHGFDEATATVSWSRTIDFFKEQLNKK